MASASSNSGFAVGKTMMPARQILGIVSPKPDAGVDVQIAKSQLYRVKIRQARFAAT